MRGYRDFTVDPKRFPQQQVTQFIEQLHNDGQHYVVITDPGACVRARILFVQNHLRVLGRVELSFVSLF